MKPELVLMPSNDDVSHKLTQGCTLGSFILFHAIWRISHHKHKNRIMVGRNVGTRAPPVSEICLKPFLDTRPDDECISP